MSNDVTRAALAAAITTLDGVTGYPRRLKAPQKLDGWVLWRGSQHAGGYAFVETWAVLILLNSADELWSDTWIEEHRDALFDALEPVMYVEAFAPAATSVNGTDAYVLMITGRSE